jgi:DNA gyrase subunit A
MRLQRLTGLERDKIREEYAELMKTIDYLNSVLADQGLRMQIIKDELLEMKEKFGDERRTQIMHTTDDISIEDMIPNEDVVVTISHAGYIKRTQLQEYRVQNRGGRGLKGVSHRDEDFVEHMFIASTHNYLLLFTEQGRCFWMKVYEVPEGARASKGRVIQNLINIPKEDKIKAFINVETLKEGDYLNNHFIMLCTKKGIIKKTTLEAYSRPRQNGINAITVREGDTLLEAKLTNGNCEIILAKKSGRALRFNEKLVRPMGRTASGVKGITLENDKDEVIGMIAVDNRETTIMVVSEKGYGKRSSLVDPATGEDIYRITGRGGKGVKTLSITDKTGKLISVKDVTNDDDLMIICKSGLTIRISVADVRVMGRATQGVRLIKIKEDDEIASVAKVKHDEDEPAAEIDGSVDTTAADVVDEAEEITDVEETGDDTETETNEPEE